MANETFTEKAKTILTALGFQVHENTITAPIWRGPEDMNIPEDITEEVARIRGYEHVENTPAKTEIKNQAFSGMVQNMRITEQVLVERCRCLQTETYPWVSEKMVEPFLQPLRPTGTPLYSGENSESQFTPLSGGEGGGRAKSRTTEEGVASRLLELQNPVNPECPLLRDSFIYQFIQIANKNAKFFDEFSIFDTGKIRTTNAPHNDEAKEFAKAHLDEQFHTGILLYKKSAKSREEDTLLEAKGIVQMLLNGLELDGEISYEATTLPYFHPKKQGNILYKGIKIWLLWAFHPLILKDHKIPENANTCFVELNQTVIEEIRSQLGERTYTYETIQDQILRRDLSFVLDEQSDFSELFKRIKSIPEIKEVEVFDVYQGENLPAGKKSVSLQIKFVGDGNMSSEDITYVMNKAIKAGESVGASLRG